jgi:hypothetical protein
MTRATPSADAFALPLLILPTIHVLLVTLTIILSSNTPGGAYDRIVGVDPLGLGVLMIFDGTLALAGFFLIFGTAWWYFIGRIGWESSQGRLSRFGAGSGALLTLFFGATGVILTKSVVNGDIRGGTLSAGAIIQYVLVGLLCVGAFVATCYSSKHALRGKKVGASPIQ